VLSVVFGLLVMIAPGAGALGLIWAIASYSILFGVLFIGLAGTPVAGLSFGRTKRNCWSVMERR
jgi:hypothetical protein